MTLQLDGPLPRELAPGVHWLGQCQSIPYHGRMLHSYSSAYLVIGEECSAMFDQGMTCDTAVIQSQLDSLLTPDTPPLRYLFISHHESPHTGGVGRFLERYPDTIACGDVDDLHLVFPEFAHRLRPLDPGDVIDLGNTELQIVEAIFRDMPYTRWAFDARRRVLFCSDGFAYTHLHTDRHCGHLAEETVATLDLDEMTALFAYAAFHWTQYTDIEPLLARLDELLAELEVEIVAPTHGLPFSDLEVVMPEIQKGYRSGSLGEEHSLVDLGYAD